MDSNSTNTRMTYFDCLDLYTSAMTVDLNEEENNHISRISLARKAYSKLLIRYTVLRVLDANEFGFTYLAKRINKDNPYIIKEFFPTEYVNRNVKKEMILRIPLEVEELTQFNYMKTFFMGEVENLEKLSKNPHKNIIKINGVERNRNNTTYIIYEYETGITLQQYIENKRDKNEVFTNQEILEFLNPLLDAVEHLHTLNIYHLDIKAENILIREDKSIMLMGFEASKVFKDEDSNTFCHAYTPQYAAPEQLESKYFSQIGKSSDIYSIGVLFYFMITGKYPLSGNERISCNQKHEDYDPYVFLQTKLELLEKYDLMVLTTVDKALMYLPKDRFTNILAFKTALTEKAPVVQDGIMSGKGIRNIFIYGLSSLAIFMAIVFSWNSLNTNDEIAINNIVEKQKEDSSTYEKLNRPTSTNEHMREVEKPEIDKEIHTIEEENDEVEINSTVKEKEDGTTDTKNIINIINPKVIEKVEIDKEMNTIEENDDEEINSTVKEKVEDTKTIVNINNNEVIEKNITTLAEPDEIDEEKSMDKPLPIENVEEESFDDKIDKNKSIENINKKPEEDNVGAIVDSKKPIEKTLISYTAQKDEVLENTVTNIRVDNTIKPKKIIKKKIIYSKKKFIHKPLKIKKKMKERAIIHKKTIARKSVEYVWYCKAFSGNIKTSAKYSNKNTSKQAALKKCRRKAGKQKNCRILNCFLIR